MEIKLSLGSTLKEIHDAFSAVSKKENRDVIVCGKEEAEEIYRLGLLEPINKDFYPEDFEIIVEDDVRFVRSREGLKLED